jgi:hypothetical protein
MEEFMEHEEEFEVRQSISSRGRDTRIQMMAGQQDESHQPMTRVTNYQRDTNAYNQEDYQQQEEQYDGEGDESSVIEEIVDEQIIELESGEEEEFMDQQNQPDDGIDQYLDNIKQEDYVNREEYQEFEENKGQSSPYRQEEMYENQLEDQQMQIQHNQELEDQQRAYQNNMMENSPIEENPIEEEMTGSPQYYQAPRAVNPKYRRKYEGVDVNDKSHLIWEQERLQRKRMEREMRKYNMSTKPFTTRDIDWNPAMNPKMAHFNTDKKYNKSDMWHFSQNSSVPMLSVNGVKQRAAVKSVKPKYDPKETSSKRNHDINNIFHQSALQKRLTDSKNSTIHAPSSHISLSKEHGKAFMTPADNKFQFNNIVSEARAKQFHSSSVF